MEIKHSNPSVARSVEAHRGKKRWPWVLLIVVIVLVVLGGIAAALYFWGGNLLSRKPAENQITNNQTGEQPTPAGGFSVNSQPDADELTQLVIGRYADTALGGPVEIAT
ncbi:MAG: hypothetical protein V1895_03740, partial [Parcubacteria group bacterium]